MHKIYFCIYLATFICNNGHVRCGGSSPKQLCVHQTEICDSDSQCGNDWDDDPQTCGQFTYWILVSGLVLRKDKLCYVEHGVCPILLAYRLYIQ